MKIITIISILLCSAALTFFLSRSIVSTFVIALLVLGAIYLFSGMRKSVLTQKS